MFGTWISRLRRGAKKLFRDQGGNALMLTAAAIVPVVGIVGSGIDIGRGYMAKLRLQQACDAGVLAGRRYMGAGSSYTDQAEAEALKMFDFNYPAGLYGSEEVSFESEPEGSADVVGTATARLPTSIMHIFGFDQFDLTVNCAAKLEISNVDVMLVLDVTGSMTTMTGGKSRMQALKEGAMVFFKTITQASQVGDGRLRIGITPYSSSVNVGKILREENSNWLSDFVVLPSRSPVVRYNWSGTNPPASVTTVTTTNGAWSNFLPISGFTGDTACSGLTPPADSMPALTASQDMNKTAYVVDRNGTRRYVTAAGSKHLVYNYRYNYNSAQSTCWLQRRTVTYDHAASPAPSSTQFYNQYRYEDRVFDVSSAKTGGNITVDTGDEGVDRTYKWSGCVIEARTTPFGSSTTAPDTALDMDVDLVPDPAQPATQWQLLIPEIAFSRARSVGDKPTFPNPTPVGTPNSAGILKSEGQAITVARTNAAGNTTYVSPETAKNGTWQSYERNWENGWGVCPAEAMKLTEMDKDDEIFFQDQINLLQPVGGTYHDSGMLWGIRLMSPDGILADENAEADNERPIKRHIIFMTDGAMSPNMGNLIFQGYEFLMQRVSGSMNTADKPELRDRHNNRFGQLCEAAKGKDITIWVIAFDLDAGADLTSLEDCSSTDTVYQPKTPTELASVFQNIAGQIARLRLSK